MVPLIHDKFRTELIARPLLKLLQDIRAYTGTVAEPLHEFLPLLVVKSQCKLMEKGGKAHHIHMRIVLTPFLKLLLHIDLCLGLSHIKCQLVRRILPVVGDKIVHMHRIPDQESQKADRILMIGNRLDHHFSGGLVVLPSIGGHHFPRGPVDDFPPTFRGINSIHLKLLGMESLHKFDTKLISSCRQAVADQIFLLYLLRILHRPVIIFPGSIIGGIDLGVLTQKSFRHSSAITVPQGVSPQLILQTYRFLHHVHICGQCQSAGHFCHLHRLPHFCAASCP